MRQRLRLTQQQLAARRGASQSRGARMEGGAADVSLDLLFRALFALGGNLEEVQTRGAAKRKGGHERRRPPRRGVA